MKDSKILKVFEQYIKKFDMNKSELAYYRKGKFPICDYCAEFYSFYREDL